MRLHGSVLNVNTPAHLVEGHVDCQKWGYGGINPEEKGGQEDSAAGSAGDVGKS